MQKISWYPVKKFATQQYIEQPTAPEIPLTQYEKLIDKIPLNILPQNEHLDVKDEHVGIVYLYNYMGKIHEEGVCEVSTMWIFSAYPIVRESI